MESTIPAKEQLVLKNCRFGGCACLDKRGRDEAVEEVRA
jgi:hypothetical protein